jgi:uncharacterized Zn-binding protein involved in type VI secretion
MAFVIREGDPTTTGGIVVAASAQFVVEHRKAARLSDPVWCPECSNMGFIAEGNPSFIEQNLPVATHDHTVKCGCPFGSNRLIATQSTVSAGDVAPQRIASELAASAEAGTKIWAQAIRDGSYQSEYTAGIPSMKVRGLAPANTCVFAKTCTVPAESTEAGTTVEPAANFGQATVMGSMAVAGQQGATTLGRIAGEAAFETLGTWSLRGAAAAAGAAAGTLLLALWPTPMGDSTLTAEQLRTMSTAPTRVRFQFRRDASGVMQIYGIHTGANSGMDSVPVVDVHWNTDRSAMEATLNGITIIWTPNDGPVAQAPTTYPGVTDALANILVHPVAQTTDTQIEIYPAADDLTWQDCILVFPADSGVPPLYLVFAKPAVTALEVDVYGAFSGRPRNGCHIDHMPSRAAVRRYLEANIRHLREHQIEEYLKKVASVAIPAKVHQKFSETYGGRNTRTKQLSDADDLRAAVDSNYDAIKPYMLEEGFAEADLEAGRDKMHETNEEQGWY